MGDSFSLSVREALYDMFASYIAIITFITLFPSYIPIITLDYFDFCIVGVRLLMIVLI